MTSSIVPLDDLIAYEAGELDWTETVELFQKLIDSGMAWRLQGSYGRMAETLLESGDCHPSKGA